MAVEHPRLEEGEQLGLVTEPGGHDDARYEPHQGEEPRVLHGRGGQELLSGTAPQQPVHSGGFLRDCPLEIVLWWFLPHQPQPFSPPLECFPELPGDDVGDDMDLVEVHLLEVRGDMGQCGLDERLGKGVIAGEVRTLRRFPVEQECQLMA